MINRTVAVMLTSDMEQDLGCIKTGMRYCDGRFCGPHLFEDEPLQQPFHLRLGDLDPIHNQHVVPPVPGRTCGSAYGVRTLADWLFLLVLFAVRIHRQQIEQQ